MAKSLFRALVALSFLAPLWLNAAPRVITLSPANTELAFAAGITPVGVSSYSDYPLAARDIEQVSTWQGMNLERIVALKPDLVMETFCQYLDLPCGDVTFGYHRLEMYADIGKDGRRELVTLESLGWEMEQQDEAKNSD